MYFVLYVFTVKCLKLDSFINFLPAYIPNSPLVVKVEAFKKYFERNSAQFSKVCDVTQFDTLSSDKQKKNRDF